MRIANGMLVVYKPKNTSADTSMILHVSIAKQFFRLFQVDFCGIHIRSLQKFMATRYELHPDALLPVVPGLVNIQKAIEAMAIEIVDLPSYKMVDLSIVM
jgi:hypothetical protein